MDADQFRKAAHAAIEESKSPIHSLRCLTSSSPTPRSHRIQPKHQHLPCPPPDQARLPRPSTTYFSTLRSSAMVQDPARHRFQNHPRPHALAVSQIHGLLPCRRHLPFHAWRNVLCRLQRTRLQLALLTSLHRARNGGTRLALSSPRPSLGLPLHLPARWWWRNPRLRL